METLEYKALITEIIEELKLNPNFKKMRNVMQHESTTVYDHTVKVAYTSCELALKLNLKVDYRTLIRGALLHDYFLYDRKKDVHQGLHGFTHARTALKNARRDYELNKVEEDVILRHMFPLNIVPPKYLESWVVCIADKLSATEEFAVGYKEKILGVLLVKSKEIQ